MTQEQMIIRHIKKFGSITPVQAMKEYGIMRLSARIWDLKDKGYPIETKIETSENRFGEKVSYAKYSLRE